MSPLRIQVNGEVREIAGPAKLTDLLVHLALDPRTIVVEHNRRIVRRDALAGTSLAEGDVVELIHFVGGG